MSWHVWHEFRGRWWHTIRANCRMATDTTICGAIRGYQLAISPLFGPTCRYFPTCSNYALEAIQKYGALSGGWLALRRILRCHPFRTGGYDPVP